MVRGTTLHRTRLTALPTRAGFLRTGLRALSCQAWYPVPPRSPRLATVLGLQQFVPHVDHSRTLPLLSTKARPAQQLATRFFAAARTATATNPAAPSATDERDPDIPPGLEEESLLSRKIIKTLNLDIPWLFNEPRLDYNSRRTTLPLFERDGKERWVLIPRWIRAPIYWALAQKAVMTTLKRLSNDQDDYLVNEFIPAVPHVLKQVLSALLERDEEALSRMCTPQLYERFRRTFAEIDKAGAKVSVSISPVSDGVNLNRDFDVRILDMWMKVAPRAYFRNPNNAGGNYSVLQCSTLTYVTDRTAVKRWAENVEMEEDDENTIRIGPFMIKRTPRPEVRRLRIDAGVLAHVKSKIDIPPVGADRKIQKAPVEIGTDRPRVEIVLSLLSDHIELKSGSSIDQINWHLSDLNYILESEQQADSDQ